MKNRHLTTCAVLSALLLCQCGDTTEPSAGPSLVETLATNLRDGEPVRYTPSPLVDAIKSQLEAAGIKTRALNDYKNDQYFCNQLLPNVREAGSLWLIFDRDDAPTVATLREFFIGQHRTSFDETFDEEKLILVRVHNELSEGARSAPRLGFEPVSRRGWLITDVQFTPKGDLMLYVTLNAIVKWRRLGSGDHGQALSMPLLHDGHEEGVYIGGESGMIGLAVSPEFETDGKIYTHYNYEYADKKRFAIVSEWTLDVSDDDVKAVSERVILKIPMSHDTHNGGAMCFSPDDGYLYIAVGDGHEPDGIISRAPADTLRGKVLRIDVRAKDPGKEYRVPVDNPFVGDDRFPPETWAWGFRNPWRISFTSDGRLIAGDIGEDRNEEITFVERGRHHGWPYVEGMYVRNAWGLAKDEFPVVPIFPYGRDYGMSVIGGHVYEGDEIEWLKGKYLFSDFLSGRIWAVDLPPVGAPLPVPPDRVMELGRWPVLFSTFGKHPSGDVYVAHTGQVFKLVPGQAGAPEIHSSSILQFSDGQAIAMFGNEIAIHQRDEIPEAEIALGRVLYEDERLSADGSTSCASCHSLDNYGMDGLKVSKGTRRNAPSTFNSARQFAQFYDYRSNTVEQASLEAHGLVSDVGLERILQGIPSYAEPFQAAFPGDGDPVSAENAGQALGAFLRQLRTRSRWDEYLDGKTEALTDVEKTGLAEFVAAGCVTCHPYRTLGGSMPQKLGLFVACAGNDKGRSEVDPKVPDYFFKVPGLINVEKTAPYYHDGSIATLEEAVDHMARVQLARELKKEQIDSIVAFLKCLTGPQPGILSGR